MVSLQNHQVTFRWRDSAHNNQQKLMTLSLDKFLRRFLLHLLPTGFVRIRHFGFLASRHRAQLLPLCFAVLDSAPTQTETATPTAQDTSPNWFCPKCGGPMVIVERLTAAQTNSAPHLSWRWLQHELSIPFRRLPMPHRATPISVFSPNHS